MSSDLLPYKFFSINPTIRTPVQIDGSHYKMIISHCEEQQFFNCNEGTLIRLNEARNENGIGGGGFKFYTYMMKQSNMDYVVIFPARSSYLNQEFSCCLHLQFRLLFWNTLPDMYSQWTSLLTHVRPISFTRTKLSLLSEFWASDSNQDNLAAVIENLDFEREREIRHASELTEIMDGPAIRIQLSRFKVLPLTRARTDSSESFEEPISQANPMEST